MAGEVGEALTGQRFDNFRRSPNMEDRRDEHSLWQNMLMAIGVPPMDRTDNAQMGMAPGAYHTWDMDKSLERPTPLGQQMGYSDTMGERPPVSIEDLLKRNQ